MSGGFQDLGLQPELVKATQDMGWMLPSDVQDETIPLMLGGGDVMVVRANSAAVVPCLNSRSTLSPSVHRLLKQEAAKRVHSFSQHYNKFTNSCNQKRRSALRVHIYLQGLLLLRHSPQHACN